MTEEEKEIEDEASKLYYKILIFGFMYPFSVLSTNRMLDTIISNNALKKRKGIRMKNDFRDLKNLDRPKLLRSVPVLRAFPGLYLGLIPFTLTNLLITYCDSYGENYTLDFIS